MKTLTTTILLILLGVLCANSLMATEFEDLQSRFEVAEAAALRPISSLNEKYTDQLQTLATQAQTEGNLEKVLAINNEIKSFASATTATPSPYDDLNRLQEIYDRERRKLQPQVWTKQLELLKTCEESIRQLQSDLTKDGKISGAVALKTELTKTVERQETITAQIARVNDRTIHADLYDLLEGTWTFTTTGNKFHIKADGAIDDNKDGARVEIIDPKRRIVRVAAHLYTLSKDGLVLSGEGLEGGSKHPAKKLEEAEPQR
ncbi:MAG: hypothetical protein O3A87_06125 [Verrucomicrobia bacterium]|nr:hypothetical protein [Verrucomicrobiota bacterium]MDA1006043.1 hypothetical protein [Verrucomicrobiota bacterium]